MLITNELVAGPTRLELATSGVTGRRSNQLNYDPAGVLTLTLLIDDCRLLIVKIRNQQSRISNASNLARMVRQGLGGTGLEPVTAGV